MSVTIQIKRGTEAQILAGTLALGELAFATDTKEVITYDGVSKQYVGRALYDVLTNRPTAAMKGRLFLASDTGLLYLDTGSAWVNGAAGVQGSQGTQGFQGTQGNQGASVTGSQGNQGFQGYQGNQGSTGSTGGTGSQGTQGVPGPVIIIQGTAAEALAQYAVVYADTTSSGQYRNALSSGTSAQSNAIGIVVQSGGIPNGTSGPIQISYGLISTGTWTAGGDIYVGTTSGSITQTFPSSGYAKPIGYAPTTSQIFFNPQVGWSVSIT